jgi:hypothetical protein
MVNTALIVLIVGVGAIAVAIIGAVMLEVYIRRQTNARLREVFGPEYKGRGNENDGTNQAHSRMIHSEHNVAASNFPTVRH